MSNSFYRAFEDRYRGSRELIKSRLTVYTPFVTPLLALYRDAAALDLGCGRGEWLELMRELGFNAHGVDIDAGMLAACHERGLRADNADAITTLQQMSSNSVALISAFHVIEHIPFSDIQKLLEEALRVLSPGGLLILETPNPENLVVGSATFYLDPSHLRPIPSALLSFATEYTGFCRNKVLRLQESAEILKSEPISLLDVLNGVSPDYSVVAQKEAPTEVLRKFDDAFRIDYGISLEELARRYDGQIVTQIAIVEAHASRVEEHAARVEEQVILAENRAVQVEAQIYKILNSRSWRITKPLRIVGGMLRRVKATVNNSKFARGGKALVKRLLHKFIQWILSRPELARIAAQTINKMPGIKRRLRILINEHPHAVNTAGVITDPSELSPRAARIHEALRKAIRQRQD